MIREIRESIRATRADLVFLQEVVGDHPDHELNHEDWPLEAQFEFLADEVWPHFAYGKNAIFPTDHGREQHHGNAILSSYPIQNWGRLNVSTNSLEQRGILYAAVQSPHWSAPIHCYNVHLDLSLAGRQWQLERLRERIVSTVDAKSALLICGDMNDWSGRAQEILEHPLGVDEVFSVTQGQHAKTFPSMFPLLRLDRVYFRGLKLKEAQVLKGQPWEDLSDHLALLADFEDLTSST